MRFEHRKIIYIVFGFIPGLAPFILAVLGLFLEIENAVHSATSSEFDSEYINISDSVTTVVLCISILYSYFCACMVIFSKEKIINIWPVISGLILGIIFCAAYGFIFSANPLFQLLFIVPAIVGVCLVFEIIP